MGTSVPLLNDYKQEFFWKRFPQTVLGGPKLRLGYDAPAYAYLNQIVLFLLPVLFGVIFTVVAEIVPDVSATIFAYVLAAVVFVFVITVNVVSLIAREKKSSISPILTNGRNILAEDDEVQFESCCGIETIEFVIPGKKFKVNIFIHALVAAAIWGAGLLYLLPTNLRTLYGDSTAAAAVICGLGWLVIGIAQYSLTVTPPPEWAQFRTIDSFENYTPLMRPFYVLVCCAVNIAAIYFPDELLLTNQVLHIFFIFLPLLWTIGFLPPLDALFLWLFEQANVVLFGGSQMATDIRTVVFLLLAIAVYIACYFIIPNSLVAVIIMSATGYLFSIDLGGLGHQLWDKCAKQKSETLELMKRDQSGFLWFWSWKEVLFHVLMLVLATGIATAADYLVTEKILDLSLLSVFGYAFLGLFVIIILLGELQSVYVLLGLWRNKLFPYSVTRTDIFKSRKKKLNALGIIRRILLNIVSPLLMMVYLGGNLEVSTFGQNTVTTGNTTTNMKIMEVMGAVRAFRWAWQSSYNSLLEISIAQIVNITLDTSTTSTLPLGIMLLIIGFLRDRLGQIINNLYVFFTLIVTSWTDKKQRRGSTIPWMVVNIVLFPFVLAVITLASSLSAPLLPLFTLPIFFIGFPRPSRFWPAQPGTSANVNPDTVFYKQLMPQISAALRKAFANGSMGDPTPGKHYIARFQDRLIWVNILERGYSYCAVSIKGLELQETSCHTVEASRIDDIIELSFERPSPFPCCSCNKYPLCTFRPRDAAIVQTYSDAKNQLTGVIDSPDTLQIILDSFKRTLVWVLLHHVHSGKQDPNKKSIVGNIEANSRPPTRNSVNRVSPAVMASNDWQKVNQDSSRGFANNRDHDDNISWQVKEFKRPATQASMASLGSAWSDNDSLLESPSAHHKVNLVTAMQNSAKSKPATANVPDKAGDFELQEPVHKSPAKKDSTDMADVDNLFDELGFGMPAMDVNQPKSSKPSPHPVLNSSRLPSLFPPKSGGSTLLPDPSKFSSPYSTRLAPPSKWTEIPIDSNKLHSALEQFPQDWYKHVLGLLEFEQGGEKGAADVGAEIAGDQELMRVYSQLVMACHMVVNVLGMSGSDAISMGTMHVHKTYSGDIPWSPASDWITEDPEFLAVVLKSYRYSVKLAIEQAIMGGMEFDLEELQEYMEEFDSKWYIGSEKDAGWTEAVESGVEQLFSFTHDAISSTYNSRVLSILPTPVYLSSVNGAAVRAQWANLNMELFYMTNDDEERYSIQAHPTLLRNLTVQAADPPLGYPIYASEPVTIPTL